jgi:hypothetical protein
VANADGSTTYYIDLGALAARKTAVMSFDLLDSARREPRTVRDVQLVRDLRANDDTATGDEDIDLDGKCSPTTSS